MLEKISGQELLAEIAKAKKTGYTIKDHKIDFVEVCENDIAELIKKEDGWFNKYRVFRDKIQVMTVQVFFELK